MNQLPTLTNLEGFTLLSENMKTWHDATPQLFSVIDRTQPETIIEVGSWIGYSAIKMAEYCEQKQMQTKILCVDTWLGSLEFWCQYADKPQWDLMLNQGYPQVYYQFLSNVIHHGMQHRITPLPMTSSIAARYIQKAMPDTICSMIYIDGSHEYEDVRADLKSYWPLLAVDGIMVGDDWNWLGVKQAVVEEFTSAAITVNGQVWDVQKI